MLSNQPPSYQHCQVSQTLSDTHSYQNYASIIESGRTLKCRRVSSLCLMKPAYWYVYVALDIKIPDILIWKIS